MPNSCQSLKYPTSVREAMIYCSIAPLGGQLFPTDGSAPLISWYFWRMTEEVIRADARNRNSKDESEKQTVEWNCLRSVLGPLRSDPCVYSRCDLTGEISETKIMYNNNSSSSAPSSSSSSSEAGDTRSSVFSRGEPLRQPRTSPPVSDSSAGEVKLTASWHASALITVSVKKLMVPEAFEGDIHAQLLVLFCLLLYLWHPWL